MNEDDIEKKIENLDVYVTEIDLATLLRIDFVDYHKMLDILDDDEEPCCDFGIFAVNHHHNSDPATGDIVISVEDEDFLECTSAQLKSYLEKFKDERRRINYVYGRATLH